MEEKKKVFIRGRKGRGDEIKGILERLGAEAKGINCNEGDCVYFINHDNEIDCVPGFSTELAQVIMDNYREIELPDSDKAFLKTHPEAAAELRLTERSEEETDKTDKAKREGSIGKRSYYGFPNGVEAEDICRYLSFNLGNVVKYACRAGRKDAKKKIEDLMKARDYLDNEIKRLEEGNE